MSQETSRCDPHTHIKEATCKSWPYHGPLCTCSTLPKDGVELDFAQLQQDANDGYSVGDRVGLLISYLQKAESAAIQWRDYAAELETKLQITQRACDIATQAYADTGPRVAERYNRAERAETKLAIVVKALHYIREIEHDTDGAYAEKVLKSLGAFLKDKDG